MSIVCPFPKHHKENPVDTATHVPIIERKAPPIREERAVTVALRNGRHEEGDTVENSLSLPFKTEFVLVNALQIDRRYQRRESQAWVDKIAGKYDPDLMRPLDVSRRSDGSLWIMDGQHRYFALVQLGYGDVLIPCHVYEGLTIEQEAKIFDTQDAIKRMTPQDRFRAKLTGNDPAAHSLKRLVERNGYTINLTDTLVGNGRFVCVGTLEEIVSSYGEPRLDAVLGLTRGAWGDDTEGLSRLVLIGLVMFEARYGTIGYDGARAVRVLAQTTPAELERDVANLRYNARRSHRSRRVTELAGRILLDRYNERLHEKNRLPGWEEAGKEMRKRAAVFASSIAVQQRG